MNRRVSSAFLCLWILCIFGISKGLGQERKGTITGRVTDANHAVLQGAQVTVQPNRATTASDGRGQFALYGVIPGHYTVTISAVGFAPFSQEVDVAAGSVANLEAVLGVGKRTEVVEVRGERQRGEVEALNRERVA
jgi:hypothetical protein